MTGEEVITTTDFRTAGGHGTPWQMSHFSIVSWRFHRLVESIARPNERTPRNGRSDSEFRVLKVNGFWRLVLTLFGCSSDIPAPS
jgi:hypothetical protein